MSIILTRRYLQSYRESGQNEKTPVRAKRSLGQNFLQDTNIARKIVNCLAIEHGESVLEIGPGPGALTAFIEEKQPGRLALVEKDAYWASEREREAGPRTHVVLADALTLRWESFDSPWKFIGNLPYNVASPLMWDICSRARGLSRAVFMIQKEVALRLTARPATSAYGALTVWIQSHVRTKLEFIVPPHVFRPRPKVDSAVVSFMPMGENNAGFPPDALGAKNLASTLKACFQMRRKQLGSIAKAFGYLPDALEAIGLDPRRRPEELSPSEFQQLAATGVFRSKS